MSDSNRVAVRYIKETTWGQTPTAALNTARVTGESLRQATQSTKSQELRSDGQTPDIVRSAVQAEGGFNLELPYSAHDDFLTGALRSDWLTAVAVTGPVGDIAATNSTSSFDSTTHDFTGDGITVGQWLKVGGFTDSSGANNGYYRVTAIAANKLTVSPAPADEVATGKTITFDGQLLQNGTTLVSFSLEKQYNDLSNVFTNYVGMVVNTFELTAAVQAIIGGRVEFLGKVEDAATATIGTGAPNAAPTTDVMNTIDHIGLIREGGAATSLKVTEFSLQVGNNLRGRPALGVLGLDSIGLGSLDVSGRLSAYFDSAAMLTKYHDWVDTDLAVRFTDGAGNSYIIDLPAVKIRAATANAGGINQDVVQPLEFEAYMHATEGKTLNINRIAA